MRVVTGAFLALSMLLSAGSAARAAGELFAYPDTPKVRAAISALATSDDLSIAAASSGDTTIVGITGNGFDRGLVVDGLGAFKRTPFAYSGTLSITKGIAAKLDSSLVIPNYDGPVILIAPVPYKFPPKCIYAICLPPDWNARVLPGDGVGSSGGIFSMSGGAITIGNGRTGGATTVGNGMGTINGMVIPNSGKP